MMYYLLHIRYEYLTNQPPGLPSAVGVNVMMCPLTIALVNSFLDF